MVISEEQVDHLTLRTIETDKQLNARKGRLLILGNAYGIMPYQAPLAEALAHHGFETYWFAFSGQEGTPGSFDRSSVLKDVSIALNYLKAKKPYEPLSMIAHCMGALIALEYFGRYESEQTQLRKLIVYGLLFNPARRFQHALPRLKKSGINLGFTVEDANYNPLPYLSLVNVPLLFCHAKDKLNRSRATEEELRMVLEVAPHAEIAWFEKGYDRDLRHLPEFIDCYCSWLKKPLNAETEEKVHAAVDN